MSFFLKIILRNIFIKNLLLLYSNEYFGLMCNIHLCFSNNRCYCRIECFFFVAIMNPNIVHQCTVLSKRSWLNMEIKESMYIENV